MVNICTMSTSKKRIHRILTSLPFFQAFCRESNIKGFVIFDPTCEPVELIVAWLEYRLPGSSIWSISLPRVALDRLVIGDMITHGAYPHLGMFLNWDPNVATLNFVQNFLGWYGIATGNSDGRTEKDWRQLAVVQIESTGTVRVEKDPKKAKGVDTASSWPILVETLTVLRSKQGMLMETFELIDDRLLVNLTDSSFSELRHLIANSPVSQEAKDSTRISSESKDEQTEGDSAWVLGRHLRALRANTGTVSKELRPYMEATNNHVRTTQARVVADPRNLSADNSAFYTRYGIKAANKGLNLVKSVGIFLVSDTISQKMGEFLTDKLEFKDKNRIADSLLSLAQAAARKDKNSAIITFAGMLAHAKREYDSKGERQLPRASKMERLLLRAAIPSLLAKS